MEDFVPYELAVKLEQKGFKQGYNIFGFKPIFPNETTIRFINKIGAYESEYFGENIPCPTISQVLKWLREEKDLFVQIMFIDKSTYYYEVIDIATAKVKCSSGDYKESPELAALAGIEYVLDNLI